MSAGKGKHLETGFKEEILEACEKRKDTQSEQIRMRMGGILTDLHAADVRYHVDCKATFLSPRSVEAAVRKDLSTDIRDSGFDSVVKYLVEKKDSIHNSIDIYTRYVKEGGKLLSKRQLIRKIVEKFEGDMVTLSSPGLHQY